MNHAEVDAKLAEIESQHSHMIRMVRHVAANITGEPTEIRKNGEQIKAIWLSPGGNRRVTVDFFPSGNMQAVLCGAFPDECLGYTVIPIDSNLGGCREIRKFLRDDPAPEPEPCKTMSREETIATVDGYTERQRQAGNLFLHIADNITGDPCSIKQDISTLPQMSGTWRSPGRERSVTVIVCQDGTFSFTTHGERIVHSGGHTASDVGKQCSAIREFLRNDPEPYKHEVSVWSGGICPCRDCEAIGRVVWDGEAS